MKVVALVSGGKDSCFNMMMCQKYGHEIVALANLLPEDKQVDELDSYMFQTVGHQLVEAYAACTALPLVRRRLVGGSRHQEMAYQITEGDEVEDLYALLAFCKERFPGLQAVSSGAIASDYQRIRVENVCSRLGLVSLAYLWHQPQGPLLRRMVAGQLHSVLVKTAALGLAPNRHLGRSIGELEGHLTTLAVRYSCNVCGEGGEYETLTLDCPLFTAARIVLDDWQVVLHSPDALAPVGVLHPTAFHLEPKTKGEAATDASGYEASGEEAHAPEVIDVPNDWRPGGPPAAAPATAAPPAAAAAGAERFAADVTEWKSAGYLHLQCCPAAATAAVSAPATEADTSSAVHAALSAVTSAASRHGLTLDNALFVHLYLGNMAHFAAANAAYCAHLPASRPPSRACVQAPLPAGRPVLLDVLLAAPQPRRELEANGASSGAASGSGAGGSGGSGGDGCGKRVLHVQSISDWAPSCIGPYSQATSYGGLVHLAGQIPLDPPVMVPIAGDLEAQARIALRHCQSVATAVRANAATGALGLTVYVAASAGSAGEGSTGSGTSSSDDAVARVAACVDRFQRSGGCSEAANSATDVNDDADVSGDGCSDSGSSSGDRALEAPMDDYLCPPALASPLAGATVYVGVPALPRGVAVEVQPLLVDLGSSMFVAASSSSSDEESEPGARRVACSGAVKPENVGTEPNGASSAAAAGAGGGGNGASAAGVHTHSCCYRGKVGRFLVAAEPPAAGSGGAEAWLAALLRGVQAAGFSAGDVASLRIWHVSPLDPAAVAAALAAISQKNEWSGEWRDRPQAAQLVPVEHVGVSFAPAGVRCTLVAEAVVARPC